MSSTREAERKNGRLIIQCREVMVQANLNTSWRKGDAISPPSFSRKGARKIYVEQKGRRRREKEGGILPSPSSDHPPPPHC